MISNGRKAMKIIERKNSFESRQFRVQDSLFLTGCQRCNLIKSTKKTNDRNRGVEDIMYF